MSRPILEGMTEDKLWELVQKVTEALSLVDKIATSRECEVSYETMQRNGFKRPTGWRRKYSLTDARTDAKSAAIQLRAAWEILDPAEPHPFKKEAV